MELKDFALPDAVDVVVLGTGLPECVLAAASARIGLSVLHLDKLSFLVFASGKSTDILIRSGVSQYIEFKSVDRVLTAYNEKLEKVPLSRNQVFQSKEIDLMDKRLLMRLLSLCWDYESRSDEWENRSRVPFPKLRAEI
ncbi:hypothetical protein M514_28277 [Trichuris suis]|uniref:Uncharacterized protein n=1 Tax=Trichuris suis TaxID=68888 RepID=A0A085MQP8_9BILA|nr:hypothetical protein M514_28277 [Trichuris suis]